VVFLDEHGVEQADAMVVAAAGAHGIFLREAQAGQGLARIEDLRARAAHGVDVRRGDRRRRRQRLQEIERGAFGTDQRACVAFDAAQQRAGGDAFAVGNVPFDARVRIEREETRVDPVAPADHRRVARDDACLRVFAGRQQVGGDVAAAEVFVERALDVAQDHVAGRWSEIGRRHESDPVGRAKQDSKPTSRGETQATGASGADAAASAAGGASAAA
jgi:hypothetical protein